MRAIVQSKYGSADVLELKDIAKPVVEDDQVLVRVRAAAVSIGEWHLMTGTPYVVRMAAGLRRPRSSVRGADVAGVVEAVGENVSSLEPGDEVFGWCKGAFAEYACAKEENFLPKPANLSFDEAAAVGDSAITALKAVRDHGKVQSGQSVLIIGASGGVGTFAVQIAKSLGGVVTGVCGPGAAEMVRSIGADQIVDYTQEDFTQGEQRYDVMIDMVGSHSLAASRRALTPRGTYVLVGVSDFGRWIGLSRQTKALLLSPFVRQSLRTFIALANREDLLAVKELVDAGKLRPIIDRRYELSEVPAALRYQGEGHARGKVVITA